jgi:hypothetical protein
MKSPFPGMDPYLEQFWPDVHAGPIIYARDQIEEQLPGNLIARVEERVVLGQRKTLARSIPTSRSPKGRAAASRTAGSPVRSPWSSR